MWRIGLILQLKLIDMVKILNFTFHHVINREHIKHKNRRPVALFCLENSV